MVYIREHASFNLGNMMFLVAVSLSLNPDKCPVYIPKDYRDVQLFKKYKELFRGIEIAETAPSLIAAHDDTDISSLRATARCGAICLDGYFQDVSLLNHDLVVDYFKEPKFVGRRIELKYGELLRTTNLTVGLSVKRGSYLHTDVASVHPFVGSGYLTRAIETFPPNAVYLVCSDDISWCRNFLRNSRFRGRHFLFAENEDALTQLFLQARCHHNIIANSVYSWWGGYLNRNPGKITCFPRNWYREGVCRSAQGLYWDGVLVLESEVA